MVHLILVRHGKSAWNKLGQWTGLTDIDLIEEGREEARRAGEALRDIAIDEAHTSELRRAQQTQEEIASVLGLKQPAIIFSALNERDYGIYTGKNKWQVRDQVGEEAFMRIRRSWDEPILGGESLKDVHARLLPYYRERLLPTLIGGRTVLITSHGNTLRALVKELEAIPENRIADLEIGTGEAYVYTIDPSGQILRKEIRAANQQKGKV